MKTWIKAVLGTAGVLALGAGAFGGWVWMASDAAFVGPRDVPAKAVPVPWPLDAAAIAAEQQARAAAQGAVDPDGVALAASVAPAELPPIPDAELAALARNRGAARGRELVELRGGCTECHGKDLAGGVVMDVPPVMGMIAPNLTTAGVTADYTGEDWDRALRHCVAPDGHALLMPCIDYAFLSDREVADIATYIGSLPPVEKTMAPSYLGPVRRVLVATGSGPLDVDAIDHTAPRREVPPDVSDKLAYGEHLAHTCKGCHGRTLSGGPIPAGDPSWPVPPNLTPHETGLQGWTFAEFDDALRRGKKRDGSQVSTFMPWKAMGQAYSDDEVQDLYAYLQTLAPKPAGQR